jgi:thiosulfate dehydrogenase
MRGGVSSHSMGSCIRRLLPILLAFSFLASCDGGTKVKTEAAQAWPKPDADALPPGSWKDTVLYGRKIISETFAVIGPEVPDLKLRYAGNNLACQSCHLNGATQKFSLPLIGVYGLFPAFMSRENEVRTLEDRIEGCMERSMNGRALPLDSKEMRAMVAYIQFLSTGLPVGQPPQGRGVPALAMLSRAADPRRGEAVYGRICAKCHQANGQGKRNGQKGEARGYQYPPLWGPDSYNDGAGMHRLISSASFIHANMPFGTIYTAPVMSVADAWDVAAYVNSKPRPKRAHLEADYPDRKRKPVDAPFPPFPDGYSLQQHQLGPYQPIIAAQQQAAGHSK